jgi:multimeric flavodoxin WrbA
VRCGAACQRADRAPSALPGQCRCGTGESFGARIMAITALGLNCTLKSGPAPSSTEKLLDQILRAIGKHHVGTAQVRVVDLDIKAGVKTDEGPGDAWPALRQRILDADILVLGTPIWMGQPSSVSKRVLERMDAFLGDIDEQGRYPTFGRVAIAAVVGNEDGAHHVCAEFYQALTDVGFTIPGGSPPYWVGEAMGSTNYIDLERTPKKLAQTIRTIASNAVHLARLLQKQPYPAP